MRIRVEITPESLIRAIRSKGNDATNLRDAVHEAHHALSAKVVGPWDRENIHRHVMRMGRGHAAFDEITARAVEQMVCHDFGIDCGSVEKWAHIACMEAIKSNIAYPSLTWFVDRVNECMKRGETRSAADWIVLLGILPSQ